MKIKLINLYVDDQERARRFYTEVMGFTQKSDFTRGSYRWLTVISPDDKDGVEIHLAPNDNPAVKSWQQAMFEQGQAVVMFNTDDLGADYQRLKERGAEFTMPPTEVTGATIATLRDSCGNLVQLTQLKGR